MKYVIYGSAKVMTGDVIASAVMAYAAALGEHRTIDVVEIPTADEYGTAAVAELLLGPATQLMLELAPDDELEPEDEGLVAELARRTIEVGGGRFADAASAHSHDAEVQRLRAAMAVRGHGS